MIGKKYERKIKEVYRIERVFLFILFLLILFPINIFGGISFKNFNCADGLSNNTVKCITQDEQGFMWFGTFDGLCRFDGLNFSVFKHDVQDKTSISNNRVSVILSVNDGLWLGTDAGLNHYSYKDGCFRRCVQQMPSGKFRIMNTLVNSIVDNGRNIFVLDSCGRIFVWKKKFEFEQCYFGKEKFCTICSYKNGLLLASSANGLYLLSQDRKSIINKYLYKTDHPAENISYSKNLDIVYVCYGIGNKSYAFKVKNNAIELSNTFAPVGLKVVIDYGKKTVWATDGKGLFVQDGKSLFSILSQNSNMSSDAVFSLFSDKEKNLWIGTYRGGIDLYSYRYDWFKSMSKENGSLTYDLVTSVCSDSTHIYTGLDGGGLNVYNTETKRLSVYNTSNSKIGGDNILSIFKDGDKVWMGLYGKGLGVFSLTDKTFKTFRLPSNTGKIDPNFIWEIKDDGNGHIWIIGPSVYIFDKKKEQFFLVPQLQNIYASGIVMDKKNIWISSTLYGIYKLDRKTQDIVEHYSDNATLFKLPSNTVRFLFMDSRHHLWFFIEYYGLYRLDIKSNRIIHFGRKGGLTDPNVTTIEEDKTGNLWIGTYNGLFCYNPKFNTFIKFDNEDNLSSSQFNYNASFQTDGQMFFGTTKGLICFNPAVIKYHQSFNKVCFLHFDLLNSGEQSYCLYGSSPETIRLKYNQNFFTIHFSVPELVSPGRVRFSCYMKGFENGWREISDNRNVSYTNVPPGKYEFYVRSTDSKGKWGSPSCLKIVITPPWWKTVWATILWVIIVLSVLYAAFRFYLHELNIKHLVQIKEMEKNTAKTINEVKWSFYTNITHELRTPVFLISAPLEELINSGKGPIAVPKSYLLAMYRNAMKLNKLISRIIDFRKLESGNLNLSLQRLNVIPFCKNLTDDYESLCQQKNIIFHYLPSKTVIQLDFDPEKLESILSNLVSNAFKFTPEYGMIELAIEDSDNCVTFHVKDNGIGIEKIHQKAIFDSFFRVDASQKNSRGDGIGLSFVKRLVELHGGTVSVESQPDKGSEFIFTIPKCHLEDDKDENYTSVLIDADENRNTGSMSIDSPTATHSILIIDDEMETVEILERFLISDFKVLKANDGITGWNIVQEALPDIIICDIMMPNMNGMDFLSLLKGDKKLSHIPVIMFTAKTTEEDMIAAFDCGADAYLTKPISLKYLRKRIDKILAQSESVNMTNLIIKSDKSYTKEEQRFLLKCREIIDNNLTNANFDIVFLAEKLGMSHSSLYKKIKSMTGLSLIEFINEYRIFKAVQYFKEGETNIGTVCVRCGFNDVKNFREMFKRKMNMTPKQFVRQL